MDARSLFYIGVILGLSGGIVLTIIVVKVRSLFSSTEVKKLSKEKKNLEKRLHEKDKYIDEMIGHAEKLAHDFGTQKSADENHS